MILNGHGQLPIAFDFDVTGRHTRCYDTRIDITSAFRPDITGIEGWLHLVDRLPVYTRPAEVEPPELGFRRPPS